ncbi:MAG: DMT family transporter [Pseudomonadota bacterium]
MKESTSAYLDLSLAMAIVGSSVVAGKLIIQVFPVFLASGMRFFIALLIVIPLAWRGGKAVFRFSPRQWGVLALMAFCGQFLFTVLLLIGLKYTSAVEAGLITCTTPAAMAILAAVVLGERPTLRQTAGIVLAILGVAAIGGFSPSALEQPGQNRLLGDALICLAVFGEAVFLLLRKTLPRETSDLSVTAALVTLGLVFFAGPALFQARTEHFIQAGPIEWAAVLYFGAVFTAVAYFLWFRGVAKVSGDSAGVFTAIMPLSAVFLSWLILKEAVGWNHLLGGALVVGAIFSTAFEAKREPGRRAEVPNP